MRVGEQWGTQEQKKMGGDASLFTVMASKHTMMIPCHDSHSLPDGLLMP